MNHLAHLYFAAPTPDSVAGNLVADFIRGRAAFEGLAPSVQRGILLHRLVDDITDSHPAAREARLLFDPRWRHLRRVFIDLFFDHFLARDWDDFLETPLRPFLDGRYALLREGALRMGDERFQAFARVVSETDRFHQYREADQMEATLRRLEKRVDSARFPSLDGVMEAFHENYDALGGCFHDFFPELISRVAQSAPEIVGPELAPHLFHQRPVSPAAPSQNRSLS